MLRNGDVVHVQGVVCDKDPNGGQRVVIDFNAATPVLVKRSDIVSVTPRPLGVGDRVKVRGGTGEKWCGTIVAVHKDRAWVDYDDTSDGTPRLSDLEPA
jgi:FKBP-type peptidyl-prolyl cis-trans isomerase 2